MIMLVITYSLHAPILHGNDNITILFQHYSEIYQAHTSKVFPIYV